MLVTFDLDGVLMLNPFRSGVFPHITKVISQQCPAEPGEVLKAIVAEARNRQLQGKMVAAYDWDDIVQQVSANYGVSWTLSVAQLVEDYCQPPHIKLYPGAQEILTDLSSQGCKLRALTNGYLMYQLPVLKALGIAHFFETILTPEAVGAAKPEQKFYFASQKNADKPHIHIGDTVIHDVWGANLVGAVSVWIKQDLPQELKDLSPRQRAMDPKIKDLVQAGIDSDMCPQCYPELEIEAALPHYLIHHLSELSTIITETKQAV